jgi:hypothetical protein
MRITLAGLDLSTTNFRFFAIVVLLVLQVSQQANTRQRCETLPDNRRHRQAAAAAAADHTAESEHRAGGLQLCGIVRHVKYAGQSNVSVLDTGHVFRELNLSWESHVMYGRREINGRTQAHIFAILEETRARGKGSEHGAHISN